MIIADCRIFAKTVLTYSTSEDYIKVYGNSIEERWVRSCLFDSEHFTKSMPVFAKIV
jgi:hypothetical protein